jgi:hypothetical protein
MKHAIINAIQNKERLSFCYSNIDRVVEPHAFGVSSKGNPVLRCFQVSGGHIHPGHEWELCDVSKISNLAPTGDHFENPRPGYKRGDKGMTTIYAEL